MQEWIDALLAAPIGVYVVGGITGSGAEATARRSVASLQELGRKAQLFYGRDRADVEETVCFVAAGGMALLLMHLPELSILEQRLMQIHADHHLSSVRGCLVQQLHSMRDGFRLERLRPADEDPDMFAMDANIYCKVPINLRREISGQFQFL